MNKIDQQAFYVRSILILNQNMKIWGVQSTYKILQNVRSPKTTKKNTHWPGYIKTTSVDRRHRRQHL